MFWKLQQIYHRLLFIFQRSALETLRTVTLYHLLLREKFLIPSLGIYWFSNWYQTNSNPGLEQDKKQNQVPSPIALPLPPCSCCSCGWQRHWGKPRSPSIQSGLKEVMHGGSLEERGGSQQLVSYSAQKDGSPRKERGVLNVSSCKLRRQLPIPQSLSSWKRTTAH